MPMEMLTYTPPVENEDSPTSNKDHTFKQKKPIGKDIRHVNMRNGLASQVTVIEAETEGIEKAVNSLMQACGRKLLGASLKL